MSGAPLLGGKPKRKSAKQVKMRTNKLFSKLRSSVNVASIAAATKGHHPRGSAASAVAAAAVPAASGLEERKTTAPVVVPPYRHHAEIQSLDHDPTAHVLSCPEHGFSDGESGDESDTDGDDTSTMRLSRARYFRAAFLLMHGQTGRSMHGHSFEEEALSTYLLVHSSYWIGTYGLIGVLHMSLGLMNANDPFSWGSGSLGIGLEAVVIFVYVLDTWLVSRLASNHSSNSSSIRSSSSSNHSDNNNDGSLGTTHDSTLDTGRAPSTSTTPNLVTSHWNHLRALLILFFGIDLLMFVCTSHQTYRVSTCLRPLMIVLRRREFRHMMRAVFVSAARIVRVLTLMGFHIGTYTSVCCYC